MHCIDMYNTIISKLIFFLLHTNPFPSYDMNKLI